MPPSSASTSEPDEIYHLFGFPIAHSASPAFHNYLFGRLGLCRLYKLTPTTHAGQLMQERCRSDRFGGASVTMPLKVSVAPILDRMTDEARIIGAVNTLVIERDEQGNKKLVGTNTDWMGIRNALLPHLPFYSHAGSCSEAPSRNPGMIIGGGGAARAAVYALASLNCAPIYLVGRDTSELSALVAQFPHVPCVPIFDASLASEIKIVVGCVPAIPPVTPEEKAADACIRKILSAPCSDGKRVFLEMCYKPRITPLMNHAASHGWTVVSGTEVMLEQGLAQARMWLAKSADPQKSLGMIPSDIEEDARKLIRGMDDIINRDEEPLPTMSAR